MRESATIQARRPVRKSKTRIPVPTRNAELLRDTTHGAKESCDVTALLKRATKHGREIGRATGVRRPTITSTTVEEHARDGATKLVKPVVKPVPKPVMAVRPVTAVTCDSELDSVPFQPAADIDCTDDPALCGEYSGDIYQYHRQLEEEEHYTIRTSFLDHQLDITSHHRQVLVDWLAQVHIRFKLLQETMLLTVDILDRYLQVRAPHSMCEWAPLCMNGHLMVCVNDCLLPSELCYVYVHVYTFLLPSLPTHPSPPPPPPPPPPR